ncbi:MAG: (2Fe-2S)-binding protein [Pseudomonadota bacterium]
MFVCLCKAVTDQDIRDQVDEGSHSFGDIQDRLSLGRGCGGCVVEAQSVYDSHIQKRAAEHNAMAHTAILVESGNLK